MCYKSHSKRVFNNCNLALITQTKNLSNNVKKSSNTGQDEETLLSIFMSFLTTSAKVQFLEDGLGSRLFFHPLLKFYQYFLIF